MWKRRALGSYASQHRAVRRSLMALLIAGLATSLIASRAAAEQRQDWYLADPGKPGNYVTLDAIFGAFQAGVEHRENIFGAANQLTVRASAIAAIPFGGTQLDADLRIVILNVGMSVGAMDSWMNQTFEPGELMTRKVRREREAGGEFNTSQFGFWEGRAGLVLPFNDYLLFNNVNAYRFTGAPSRTFDNLIGVVHDGNYLKSEFQLFLKHRDYGGIGPMLQVLNFGLDGARHTQINYGFVLLSRAGLVRRDDFVFFQMLFNSQLFGGYDNSNVYGMAVLRGPVSFTLVYRSIINL